METGINYLPIFLVMLIAWVVPVLMANIRFIKIPPVIVEIMLGFVVGKNMLNLLPETSYMDFLALTGFLFLLFMSGLGIDVNQIMSSMPRGRLKFSQVIQNPLLIAILIYIGNLILSVLAALILRNFVAIDDIIFLSLVIPTVALSIVAPVLKEQGDIGKKHGQVIMLVGAISTIASIILISLYSGVLREGLNSELFLFLIIFATFFFAVFAGRYMIKIPLFKSLLYRLAHAASQIRVRGTIALIFGFVTVAYLIKVELVLGAFLTGILLSIFLAKERSALIIKLDGMSYGFFVPVFFIMVGANLDISALDQFDNSYLFLAVLLVCMFAVQVIPTMLMSKVFGIKTALSSGLLLTSRLGLTIASAQIGLQLGVISPAVNAAIVIVSIVSSIIAPVLYNQLHPRSDYVADKIIIIGASSTSILLAERLRLHGKDTIIVEVDSQKHQQLSQQGLRVELGSGMDLDVYRKLNLKPQNYVVVLTGSERRNVKVAELIKKEFEHERIITDVVKDEYLQHLSNLNIVDLDVNGIIASAIENMIFRPDTYHHIFENFGQFSVEDITITNKEIEGKLIREIPFHKDGSLMVIYRNDRAIIPHGNTTLLLGDIMTVIGMDSALEDFRGKFQ